MVSDDDWLHAQKQIAPAQRAASIKDPKERAILWLAKNPGQRYTVNELVDGINISKSTAQRIIPELVESGFLEKTTVGPAHQLGCNTQHIYVRSRKIGYVLRNLYESGVLEHIKKHAPHPRSMTLFGSYASGQDTADSDIDIAVEVLDDNELRIGTAARFTQLAYRKDVPVSVHVFDRKHVDANLFSNIANGIVLDGYLEVRP